MFPVGVVHVKVKLQKEWDKWKCLESAYLMSKACWNTPTCSVMITIQYLYIYNILTYVVVFHCYTFTVKLRHSRTRDLADSLVVMSM